MFLFLERQLSRLCLFGLAVDFRPSQPLGPQNTFSYSQLQSQNQSTRKETFTIADPVEATQEDTPNSRLCLFVHVHTP